MCLLSYSFPNATGSGTRCLSVSVALNSNGSIVMDMSTMDTHNHDCCCTALNVGVTLEQVAMIEKDCEK